MSFALAVAREEFQRLSAADLSQQDFQGVWAAHFYGTGVHRPNEANTSVNTCLLPVPNPRPRSHEAIAYLIRG